MSKFISSISYILLFCGLAYAGIAEKLIEGGREEVKNRPAYRSTYYSGGYPPKNEGVCTDLIWRAFAHAGYDLKTLIDSDIKANKALYPSSIDSNIDFRRVPNQLIFIKRHSENLTTIFKLGDKENMKEWQAGDLVTFANPNHIAILSDKTNIYGVPLLIHNAGPWATENDAFIKWYNGGITGHFRIIESSLNQVK